MFIYVDWIKIGLVIVVLYLLYKEFTRKTSLNIEGFDSAEAGLVMDSNGITFNKPVNFKSTTTGIQVGIDGISSTNAGITINKPVKFTNPIDCNTINMADNKFSVRIEEPNSNDGAFFVIRNNNNLNGDTRFAMGFKNGIYSMSRNGKNLINCHQSVQLGDGSSNLGVSIPDNLTVEKNLFVGKDPHKWHLRDNRIGITGKFDLVPGFTPGSTANDNWVRMLEYNSLDAGKYFKDGGLASDRLWVGKESWLNNKVNIPNLNITSEEYKCGNEHGTCVTGFDGRVIYSQDGQRHRSSTRDFAPGQNIGCNNGIFGDPIPGTVKSCYTKRLKIN